MSASRKSEKAVPSSRIGRFGRLAQMTAGIATGVAAEGLRQLTNGNRPALSDLLLTPANAKRLANQLAAMRGAAMKVGQLLSMESGDFLPKELAGILAQLRDSAFTMPRRQLHQCMRESYGDDWRQRFSAFDETPLAAASIGQVHRATTLDKQDIVLKIQYPGVAKSIDSDVDNIASLLRITQLLPEHLDISGVLEDAKQQLHDEANYLVEASYLRRFYDAFEQREDVLVPALFDELTTEHILAMEYAPGLPIDDIVYEKAVDVNEVMTRMFEIMLTEFFDLNLMQTDANFANFRYQADSNRLVLLDFGASRSFDPQFIEHYSQLITAAIKDDSQTLLDAADALGYQTQQANPAYQALMVSVFRLVFEPFRTEGDYDFAQGSLSQRLSELGDQAYDFKRYWQTPPTDILYLHRKLGGLYLLAARLEAVVDCRQLLGRWLPL